MQSVLACCRFQSTDQSLSRAVMALAQHVHAEHAELADAMLSTLWGMFEGWGLGDKAATSATQAHSPESNMQAAGDKQPINCKLACQGQTSCPMFCLCLTLAAYHTACWVAMVSVNAFDCIVIIQSIPHKLMPHLLQDCALCEEQQTVCTTSEVLFGLCILLPC